MGSGPGFKGAVVHEEWLRCLLQLPDSPRCQARARVGPPHLGRVGVRRRLRVRFRVRVRVRVRVGLRVRVRVRVSEAER